MATQPVTRVVNAHAHRSVRLCPLCGLLPRHENRIHEQHFVGHARQDIYRCECGMIFADSGLTQFWYDQYYRERSKYHDYGGVTVFDDPRRHHHTATYISPFVNKSSRILDFGCANGNLLKVLDEHTFTNLWGYDPCPVSTKKAKDEGIKIVNTLVGERFDGIVMAHVLEHVYDVSGVMSEIMLALNDNGVLYLEVPDASRYQAVSPYQEFNVEHVNHFTLPSLCQLAGRFGLVPLHVGQKTFACGDGFAMHAIFGVFRKAPKVDLRFYLESSAAKMQSINERLEVALRGIEKVTIWGAGQLTLKLLALPALQERSVRLVDANLAIQGTKLSDRIVESPEAIQQDDVIVVGSILNEKSILKSIRALNLPNPIIFLTAESTQV